MSLLVDMKKSLGGFQLDMRFEAENEVLALLGSSGCGKSMTLKCIAGIETPDEGRIVLDGVTLFDSGKGVNLSPQKRRTGFLFQSSALFPNMTVEQNILCGMHRESNAEKKRQRVREMIRLFYLNGLQAHYPAQLSGGQQQRAALARILISEPRILMLDEPFSALDSYLRWKLEQELAATFAGFGGTVLFVSHNRDEAYRLCDRIAVVSQGHIDRMGDKWELFDDPQTYAACLLTGCKNISPVARGGATTIVSQQWGITLETHRAAAEDLRYAGIRARMLEPCAEQAENAFEFEVVRRMEDTFNCVLMIRPAGRQDARPICWEMGKKQYQELEAARVRYVRIAPEKILLLR